VNPLLKLLADNRGVGQFRADAAEQEATIYLYDVIVADDYWGGIGVESFVRTLNSLTAPVIHLRFDCPGGDVFAGRAMEQAIREHPSKIIAHIDGYAASAASYVALAADEVLISEGGFFMIHKAWTIAIGNADELMDVAGLLEKIDGTLVKTYARETGQTPEQLNEWIAATTWFDAEEAIEYGFATGMDTLGSKAKAKAPAQHWNLAAYGHAPQPAPVAEPDPVPEPEPTPEPIAAYNNSHTDHLARRLRLVAHAA